MVNYFKNHRTALGGSCVFNYTPLKNIYTYCMKNLLLAIGLTLLMHGAHAQTDTAFIYTGTVKLDTTISTKQFLATAVNWLKQQYNNAPIELIQVEKPTEQLALRQTFKYTPPAGEHLACMAGVIEFTLELSAKKGSYTYTFKDFKHINEVTANCNSTWSINNLPYRNKSVFAAEGMFKKWTENVLAEAVRQADVQIPALIESLKKYVAKNATIKGAK